MSKLNRTFTELFLSSGEQLPTLSIELPVSLEEKGAINFARHLVEVARANPDVQAFMFSVPATQTTDKVDLHRILTLGATIMLGKHALNAWWISEEKQDSPLVIVRTKTELAIPIPGENREQDTHLFNDARFLLLDLLFGVTTLWQKYMTGAIGADAPTLRLNQETGLYQWLVDQQRTNEFILGLDAMAQVHSFYANEIVTTHSADRAKQRGEEYIDRYDVPFVTIDDDVTQSSAGWFGQQSEYIGSVTYLST